mmetsp:Transcript_10956/g.24855  ORF Transcript_10956/g.24855 Transcript_10956/m.24855 type:complete len:199 (-) Transcript_10956:485-1081(-)
MAEGDIHDEPLGGEKWQKVPSATLKENRLWQEAVKVALWQDQKKSALIMFVGLSWYYFTAVRGWSLVSLLCIGALLHLLAALAPKMYGNKDKQEVPVVFQMNASVIAEHTKILVATINCVSDWYQEQLTSSQYNNILKIVGIYTLGLLAGTLFRDSTIILLVFLGAMAIPALYTKHRQIIDPYLTPLCFQTDVKSKSS